MSICSWIFFGLFAGLLARALTPGEQRMGIVRTTLLGIFGSFVGGFLGALLSGRNIWQLQSSSFLGAVIGAIVLLLLGRWLFTRPAGLG